MTRHAMGVKKGAKVACAGMLAVFVLCILVFASAASAAETPRWQVTVTTEPTHVVPGSSEARLVVIATNVGGAATNGGTVTLSDTLGAGLTATGTPVGYDAYGSGQAKDGEPNFPSTDSELNCAPAPAVECTYSKAVDPGDQLVMTVTFSAASAKNGETIANVASVSGGGAQPVMDSATKVVVSSTPAPFGPAPESVLAALSTNQAGAHPNVTTEFTLDTSKSYGVSADVKDIRFDLPPGLVGSTVGMPRCSMQKVIEETEHPGLCPTDSMVGIATAATEEHSHSREVFVTPIYNIVPSPGEPAAFAFDADVLPVRLDTSVLSDGEDNIRVTAPSLPETAQTIQFSSTVWGVPAEHSGPGIGLSFVDAGDLYEGKESSSFGGPDQGQSRVPILTNPQQCEKPLEAVMSADPWGDPGAFVSQGASMGTMTGCGLVPFSTGLNVLPDTFEAGEPAGYQFNVTVPQHNEPNVLATSSVKNTVMTLPEGVVVNPSAAWGLESCSNEQFYGPGRGPGHLAQEPAEEEECPNASKVGEVEVHSPDVEVPLKGSVYLGSPECDPCTPQDAAEGKMARLLMQLVVEREPGVHILEDQPNVNVTHGEGGIIVKLEGRTKINQETGQITAVLENTPQLPFSEFKLVLEGGPRAVLANPRTCGKSVATTQADFTPWSTEPGVSDSTPSYEFVVDGEGKNCDGRQFSPSINAGPTNLQAGAYAPLDVSFSRSDQDQYLSGLELKTPPGLVGTIANVPLCANAQAEAGECPEASLIGHTQVETGPGATPFLVTGGKIYLTETYGGAPYGLSIVVPAVAGPYTLSGTTGKGTVVVRAKIEVNPTTAALTVKTNPFPTMLDGIPLQLRLVQAEVDRSSFIFNPTSCEPTHVEGTLFSAEKMSSSFSRPLQVTNCGDLKFEPHVEAFVSGKVTKANGTSLVVKIGKPAVQGVQADIKRFKIELPVQLPSRLTTLQKACTSAQFEANPAGCPSESVIGQMKVLTPILPVPIEGPMYFVSHGGEAFPSLEIVLQGYGVKVILVGTTYISPAGITSSTFSTLPDVPFTFAEAALHNGPFSALTGTGNLCAPTKTVTVKRKVEVTKHGHVLRNKHGKVVYRTKKVSKTEATSLVIPTEMVAQSGGNPIHVDTPVQVTECPKSVVKTAKKGKKKTHKKKGHKKS